MIQELITKFSINQSWKNDIAGMKKKLSQCETVGLTKGQIADIQNFYKRVAGTTVPTYWHEYFYTRNGNFSVNYVPTCFYHKELICRLNDCKLMYAYVDKGFYDFYFPDIRRPRTIVKNINGYYYCGDSSISKAEALEICSNLETAIIKPSRNSMWGRGVRVISTKDGLYRGESIDMLFSEYGKNFIIQEKVTQHEKMSMLNPSSLNTLRVLSYRHNDEIIILYVIVRIGRAGKTVDNESAGGINADINLDSGRIIECAYGTPKEKRIYQTDNGTELKDFEIPSVQKVVSMVKDLHLRLPYFNLIGWDWGIDCYGEPVLIEWNRDPDLSQTAHGPAFGEMTEMIIKDTLKKKDTRF